MIINSFQVRVARSVTGINIREVALYLGVSRTIISKWENLDPFEEIKTKKINLSSLVFFYNQHKIIFPYNYSVTLDQHTVANNNQLTRFHLRGGRATLNLTQRELSSLTGYTVAEINYLEILDNLTFLDQTNKKIDINNLRNFFEGKGLSFPKPNTILYNPAFQKK
jgi:DNA-binding XRE family transcriptional regulator